MASVKRDNDLPPRMLAADVIQRGARAFEWIAPVDDGAHLSFVCEVREIFEVRPVHLGDESHQMLVDERVDDLAFEHPENRPDPRLLLRAADSDQRATGLEYAAQREYSVIADGIEDEV